ncbi:UvrD-helicase domain-containing protein [Clostridium sp. DJ247]|uniref:HelD family protein n=1 Tax=Clostridium sp. DJ247 TaxID=2726188 RepID=UPI0016265063|nr:UvrD-helicase domain-containing protein [Clostridium sp. DJ247]MBC2579735.1 AAA family ATPase [Clostridium sp. DJ247]
MESSELERELTKELELNFEKEKLEEVIGEIKKQISVFVQKRKQAAEYIVNARKKSLEEYRDDEDKVAEYFDHEAYIREETFKYVDRRLRELNILSASPYFGKIDFEDDLGAENFYIGRFGVTKEEEYEPIVVDWRSPISALFYAGKLGEVVYKAPEGDITANILSKRQFVIKKAKLLGMFDSSIDVKDEILQMVLSKNAGDKLKDIVMTIQQEQDNIIRQPRNKTIVVDGVAGSGKTTIALHRVAYLLYNYRNILQDKVLILGPNSIFVDYISMVLPSLGEVGVKQTTFRDFVLEILDIDNVMSFKDYMEKTLSNHKEFNEEIMYKGSVEYIKELDSFIEALNYNYFNITNVDFYNEVIVDGNEIYEMFEKHFRDMPLFRRSKKIKRIIYSKIRDKRDSIVRQIQKEHEESIKSLSPDELKIQQNNLEFIKRNRIRDTIKEVMRIKKNLSWINNPDVIELYNNFNNNKQLTYDDLSPILYLKIKLDGLKYKREIKHVVIDEAQDYSPLQFLVIKELTGCKSFTVVGDSNQRIVPIKGEPAMLNLEHVLLDTEIEHFKLSKSYRSTKEIMNYANKYLKSNKTVPLVRNGEEVVEKQVQNITELVDKIVDNVIKLKERNYESIAIVCRDLEETKILGNLIKSKIHIKMIDREDIIYSSGEVILPCYFAKGLEFDSVIVIDTVNTDSQQEDKLMYVMSTRALHELFIYKTSSIK